MMLHRRAELSFSLKVNATFVRCGFESHSRHLMYKLMEPPAG